MFYIIYFIILFIILFCILLFSIRLNKNYYTRSLEILSIRENGRIRNEKGAYDFKNNFNKLESFSNKEKMTAIIIEPREHKAFEFVINNFLENLSDNWDFIIFHGNKNKIYIENIINNILNKNKLLNIKDRIKLINLNIDNLSLDDYNKLLTTPNFYKYINTEIFLIFQTDSIICKENKNNINKFLDYDYVGAPWKDKNVGNGGLSLRKKSKMLEIINKCIYKKNTPEDVYFGLSCPEIIRNKPSFEDAQNFSVEAIYNDNTFGVHKPWLHLKKNDYKNMETKCSGLSELRMLNKL